MAAALPPRYFSIKCRFFGSREKRATVAKLREKYEKNVERYGEEQKEIEAEARKLENEVTVVARRATRFDLGDTFLEIALVITSVTLLTGKRSFWGFGMVLGVIGVLAAVSAVFVTDGELKFATVPCCSFNRHLFTSSVSKRSPVHPSPLLTRHIALHHLQL